MNKGSEGGREGGREGSEGGGENKLVEERPGKVHKTRQIGPHSKP